MEIPNAWGPNSVIAENKQYKNCKKYPKHDEQVASWESSGNFN